MNKKRIVVFIVIIAIVGTVFLIKHYRYRDYFGASYKPEGGYVSDEQTAIKIAEAILESIYGETLNESKALSANYDSKMKAWIIGGHLPPESLGGIPIIVIRKRDGKILHLSHSM